MKKITTPDAPKPAGHYSQAIVHNGMVFVAGQLPLDAKGQMVEGGIESQVRQTMKNIEAILNAAGSGMDRILKSSIFIPDIEYWPEINRVYAEIMGDHRPARAVIPCGVLHYEAMLEMDVIAALNEN